jgi:hypothetical protein
MAVLKIALFHHLAHHQILLLPHPHLPQPHLLNPHNDFELRYVEIGELMVL